MTNPNNVVSIGGFRALKSSPFHVSRHVRKYTSYLDTGDFKKSLASDGALTICDLHNILCKRNFGAWVKSWLHCDMQACQLRLVPVLRRTVYSFAVMKTLSGKWTTDACETLQRTGASEIVPILIVLHRSFSHLYWAEIFDYLAFDWDLELCLRPHATGIYSSWRNV